MDITTLIPLLALAAFLLATVWISALPSTAATVSHRPAWMIPAALMVAFAVLTLIAVVDEGPFGFWDNHIHNFWGNQVWVDLLMALGIGWYLIRPRMLAHHMSPWPWLALLCGTGSIGLVALLARVLYLDARGDRSLLEQRFGGPHQSSTSEVSGY
jgi:hypothetical protein